MFVTVGYDDVVETVTKRSTTRGNFMSFLRGDRNPPFIFVITVLQHNPIYKCMTIPVYSIICEAMERTRSNTVLRSQITMYGLLCFCS